MPKGVSCWPGCGKTRNLVAATPKSTAEGFPRLPDPATGAWSCLFINGRCNASCFYCPTSQDENASRCQMASPLRLPMIMPSTLLRSGSPGPASAGGAAPYPYRPLHISPLFGGAAAIQSTSGSIPTERCLPRYRRPLKMPVSARSVSMSERPASTWQSFTFGWRYSDGDGGNSDGPGRRASLRIKLVEMAVAGVQIGIYINCD